MKNNLTTKLTADIKKFAFAYFIMFLLPLSILAVFLYNFSVENTKRQTITTEIEKIAQAEAFLEDVLKKMDETTTQIALNNKLTPFYLFHDYYSRDAKQELNNYRAMLPFIEEVFLFFPDRNSFFSYSGALTADNFIHTNYHFDDAQIQQLLSQNSTGLVAVSTQKQEKVLIYITSLKNRTNEMYGKTLFIINNHKMIADLTDYLGKDFLALNSNYDTLFYSNPKLSTPSVRKLLQEEQYERFKTTYEHYFVVQSDGKLPYRLVSFVDVANFRTPLKKMQFFFFSLIMILFVMGILLSLYFAFKQLLPIKKINDSFSKISNTLEESGNETTDSVFDALQKNTDKLIERNYQLSDQLSKQKHDWKLHNIKQLLNGHRLSENDLAFTKEQYPQKYTTYAVAILNTAAQKSRAEMLKIKTVLMNLMPLQTDTYEVKSVEFPLEHDLLVLVFAFAGPQSAIYMEMVKLCQSFDKFIDYDNQLVFGRYTQSLNDLNQSYIDAMMLAEKNNGNPHEKIIFYQPVNTYSSLSEDFLNSPTMQIFSKSILDGNLELAQNNIKDIFQYLQSTNLPLELKKSYMYEVKNIILKCASQMNLSIPDDLQEKMLKSHNLFTLEQELTEVVSWLCRQTNETKQKKQSHLQKTILKEIEQNYRSQSFSLEELSLTLNYSVSYISQLIKLETGLTFSKYVQAKRLDFIKNELINTDKTIKDIVTSAGYYDVSNYTRQFRQLVGCTPGQFRYLNRTHTT